MGPLDGECRDDIFRLPSPQGAPCNHTPHIFIWNSMGLSRTYNTYFIQNYSVFCKELDTEFRHRMLMLMFSSLAIDVPGYRGMSLNSVCPATSLSEDIWRQVSILKGSIHTVGQVYPGAHLVVSGSTYSSCPQADSLLRRDFHAPLPLATLTSFLRRKAQACEQRRSHWGLLWDYRNATQ